MTQPFFNEINIMSQQYLADNVTETNSNDLNFVEVPRVPIKTAVLGHRKIAVYSDKWCEQSGYTSGVDTKNSWFAITLHVPYADSSYFAIACDSGSNATTYSAQVGSPSMNSPSTLYIALSEPGAVRWKTEGYISDETMASLFTDSSPI